VIRYGIIGTVMMGIENIAVGQVIEWDDAMSSDLQLVPDSADLDTEGDKYFTPKGLARGGIR